MTKKKCSLRNEKLNANRASETEEQRKERLRITRNNESEVKLKRNLRLEKVVASKHCWPWRQKKKEKNKTGE